MGIEENIKRSADALERIAAALEAALAQSAGGAGQDLAAPAAKKKTAVPTPPAKTEVVEEDDPLGDMGGEDEPKAMTHDEFRGKIKALIVSANTAQEKTRGTDLAKAVIQKLGYKKLDDVQPEKYQEFLDALGAAIKKGSKK